MTSVNEMNAYNRGVADGKKQEALRIQGMTEKTFILTDMCMWEKNRQEGDMSDHAIIVIDEATGQMHVIDGGSKIKFIEGKISEPMNQERYNALEHETEIKP